MQRGDVLDGRFELHGQVASGGMGEVFRAHDRASGEPVAIKLLLAGHTDDGGRFEREARVLADLHHPGIVRYVAHGVATSGQRYLAMEWLEGEDLSRRLGRGNLTLVESITLARHAAEALSAAHRRGVVHRDLKPGNLFLVAGGVDEVKVLDFGIAWLGGGTRVTATGMLIGTPGYMAPEQVQSGQAIDTRADVFALGCVLFECLTGRPAFTGDHFMAVLGKVLFEEAPPARELRPGIPRALDALVMRMLAKDPDERPRDGLAVATALEAIGVMDLSHADTLQIDVAPPSALTASERRVLSVVLRIREPAPREGAPTLGAGVRTADEATLRRVAEARGGRLVMLIDGSAMVTIAGTTRIATDLAAQAARCALALHAVCPDRAMALATGRAEVTTRLPVGDVIDRATAMLGALAARGAIAIDDVTAGLLDARFDVVEGAGVLELHGEREIAVGTRTLLGKPTAFVGREWELTSLDGLLGACIGESMPRTVLVTAPPGLGKSRLAQELMERARRRNDEIQIWCARGDPLRVGSAFGMLGQALRGVLGLQEGEPIEARRQKLRARVERHVPAADAQRVAELLGEIVGTPFSDEDSAALRAARLDAQAMGDQMRRAFVEFLRAETSNHPVLVVLDDLHWGDLPTVRFIDAALRDAGDRPWMVLALARPEVNNLFPSLWSERGLQELRLKELSRKASELLVRQVLGDSVGKDTTERIVQRADGNAFYLEELIRAAKERKGEALPETVLAMVQARLEGLEGEARRVLRAASVFGEVFWSGGVEALLGGAERPAKADLWLSALVERELFVRRPESTFPGEAEFAFRHALFREGAYAMLTEEDRILGHRLAARFLEQRGESDPMVLAEHFERGREPDRAGSFYLRAAELAHLASDVDTAVARARRGLECGVPREGRIALLGLLSEASLWRNEWNLAGAHAQEVLGLAAPGSAAWARAVAAKIMHAQIVGEPEELVAMLGILTGTDPLPGALGAFAVAVSLVLYTLNVTGRFDLADACVRRFRAVIDPIAARDAPGLNADERMIVCTAQVSLGSSYWFLGMFDQASRCLRDAMLAGESFGPVSSYGGLYLVAALSDRGDLAEARGEANRSVELGRAREHPLEEGRGRWALADVLLRLGELEAAEREALAAQQLLASAPGDRLAVTALLAAIQLAQGRTSDAMITGREAIAGYDQMGRMGFKAVFARLVHARILDAAGDREGARAAIRTARDRVLADAARISDPEIRRTFLAAVPENAGTLELAAQWLHDAQ